MHSVIVESRAKHGAELPARYAYNTAWNPPSMHRFITWMVSNGLLKIKQAHVCYSYRSRLEHGEVLSQVKRIMKENDACFQVWSTSVWNGHRSYITHSGYL